MNRAKRLLGITLVSAALAAVPLIPATSSAVEEGQGRPSWTIYSHPQVRWGSNDRTIFTFDFLVPFWQTEKDILFFNPRGSLDDCDGSEVNLGFGYRRLLFGDRAILGVNGYYDCRWTGWGTRHEQAGLGAEVMTEWVTGRVNGYFPVTGPQLGPMGVSGYYFRDVGIYSGTGSGIEETLGGFDGELGFKVPYLSRYVETWIYAGGYHFEGDYVGDVNGFSSRMEVIPTDFLRLGFEYRNDNLAGDEYFGEAMVTIPFSVENLVKGKNPFAGIGSRLGGDRTLHERLTEPVRRDVDVRVYIAGSGPGLPGTETLLDDVVFVSENAGSIAGTRDGTFEHPYASIDEAMTDPGSGVLSGVATVHVMDDGGAYAGGGTVGLSGLTIWGSGQPHPVYGVISNQYRTAPDIYRLDVTGNNVEIFGGTFVDAYGIVSGGTGTNIHDNTFNGNSSSGVSVTGGSATITRNTFTGTYGIYGTGGSSTVTGNDFLNNTFGIYADGGEFTITGNTIGTAAGPVTDTGIYAGGGTTLNPVTGNSIVVSGTGDAYGIRSFVENLVLSDNTVDVTGTGGTAYGIYEGPVAGDIFGSVTGGTITASGNEAYGAYLHAEGGSIGGSGSPFTISGAAINADASGGPACGITMLASEYLYALVTDVTVNAGGTGDADGIRLDANNGIYANIVHGAIIVTSGSWGGAYGIYECSDSGDIFGSITGGSITASGGVARGAVLYADGGSIGDLSDSFTVSGASITANGMHTTSGLRMEALGNLYAAITNNAIVAVSDGFGYGIDEHSYTGDIVGSISGGSITVSAGFAYGAHLYASGSIGSLANPFTITDAVIDATGTLLAPYGIMAYGICLEGDNDLYVSTSGATISAGGAADSCGIFLTGVNHSGSIANSTISGMSTDGTWYGIYGYSDGGVISGSITGGSIAGNGRNAYGVLLEADGGSIGGSGSPFTISGAAINASGSGGSAYGINMLAYEYLYASVTGATINAGGAGDTCGLRLDANSGIHGDFGDSAITVESGSGTGYGILERSNTGGIFGSIIGGSIVTSGAAAYGAYLYIDEPYGSIGSLANPFTVSGVSIAANGISYGMGLYMWAIGNLYTPISNCTIALTAGSGIACGIYQSTLFDISGSITGGSITASGRTAYGAHLYSTGAIGSLSDPFTVSGASITTNGIYNARGLSIYASDDLYTMISNSVIIAAAGSIHAYGIYECSGAGDIFGSISGGSVSVAGNNAYGVWLEADGSIGGAADPFAISGLTVDATATGGEAVGINECSETGNIFGTITGGSITAGGYDYACGIYSESISGSVGDSANPFTVSGATINTTVAAGNGYGVYLTGGTYTVTGNTFPSAYGSYTTGIYSAGGTLTATDNTFSNYYGLYQLFGSSTVSNNAFFNSGIVERTGALTVTGNSFTNSGIIVYDGSAIIGTLTAGTGNTFAGGGGAISASGGYVSIIGNTIGTSENPLEVYGIYLGSGASLMDPIYQNDIIVNGTGPDAYGIYSETPNLSMTDSTIRVTNPSGNAYGIFAYAADTLSSPFGYTLVSATGLNAYGIRLDGYRIGAPSGPYYMTMNYIVIDATATGGLGSRACGIDVSAGYAVQDLTLDWCQLNITAPSGDARGVSIIAATPYDDGPIAASLRHINATIDGGASRYFLYLSGDPGGGNGVDWSGNTYTPVGGSWSGNYDVGGYATPGPVWTNIPDAEITP